MVYFGPAPTRVPTEMKKVLNLRGMHKPFTELLNAIYQVMKVGENYRACRCCIQCECYWLIPKRMEDPGMQFICPDCMSQGGPYR